MARDLFHQNVKKALKNEGWKVTDDPLTFKIGKMQVQIDLGAERLIEAFTINQPKPLRNG